MAFNKIILEGRLTKDVEIRYTSTGLAMSKSDIVVSKKFTSNGETKEKTLFVTIQFWKRSAEIFNQFCRKGSRVLVEGELENNDYTGSDGIKRYGYIVNVISMQMLDSKNDNQSYSQDNHNVNEPKQNQEPEYNNVPVIDIDEDEIPF